MSRVPLPVSAAVEGIVDECVLRRLMEAAGVPAGPIHVAGGKARLREKINGYNRAAAHAPWIVLVDLDRAIDCAPALCTEWLPSPGAFMSFRVAVREVESWLLADRDALAHFLGVSAASVPRAPDDLDDPQQTLINLARRSRSRDIREDMVPRPGSGRSEGPAYASRMIEFASGPWRPSVAKQTSDSLLRCCQALERVSSKRKAPKNPKG